MSLKFRILSSVIFLFIVFFFVNFISSYFVIKKTMHSHRLQIDNQIIKYDDDWNSLLLKFLANTITRYIEEIDYVFDSLDSSPEWKVAFLPDDHNIKTKNWATAASLVSTFPWIDLVNVTINNKNNAYIHFTPPFLDRYVQIQVKKNIFLFITEGEKNPYDCFIGVPFFTDPNQSNYIKEVESPTSDTIPIESQWLLYDLKSLINLPVDIYQVRNDLLTYIESINKKKQTHLFDQVLNPIKENIKIIQKSLKDSPLLVEKLLNKKTRQTFLQNLVKDVDFVDIKEKSECKGPLCKYRNLNTHSKWFSLSDFKHGNYLQDLTWQFFMVNRIGPWFFDPFSKYAPIGFASTTTEGEYSIDNIAEGTLLKYIILKTPIKITPHCNFKSTTPDFDKNIIFKNTPQGILTSCYENNINLHFNEKLNTPYLTSTKFIKMKKTQTSPWNTTALTIGVNLDDLFTELAITTGDFLLISKNNNYRFYYGDGRITNVYSLSEIHKKQLLNEDDGTITREDGSITYFIRLGSITDDDGYIVLIEAEGSRSEFISVFGKGVDQVLKRITLTNILISVICIFIVCLILLKIISKITRPINELSIATENIGKGKLDEIQLDKKYLSEKDEVGKLYSSFAEMIHSMQEGEKVRGLLDKVVSKEIAAKIVKEGVNLSGEIKHISILFCDIRGFTSITEKMDPKDVLTMLNDCLTILSNSIDSFDGVIDNFEGDCIMALFGAPIDTTDHAKKAVDCALDMQKNLSIWNKNRDDNNLQRLDIGIGIHTGDAVAGNVGTQNHLSYSVLGHMVNLTSRICDVAKPQQILISKETLDEYPDIITEEQPPQEFKGISEPIITFAVMKKK